MKRNTRSIIALFTMFVMLFTMPGTVFAINEIISTEEAVFRVREIEGLRTTNSETYLLSDGTYQCVVFAEDKYYEAENNTLQLIDNAIVEEVSAGDVSVSSSAGRSSRYKNTANAHKTVFSGSGTPEISIEKDGYAIAFSPVTASSSIFSTFQCQNPASSNISVGRVENCAPLSAITPTGNDTATYQNVFTDTDLVYVVKNSALKEYIVLNSTDSPNIFSFTYTMTDLTLQAVDGRLYFTNAQGEAVFALGSLFG